MIGSSPKLGDRTCENRMLADARIAYDLQNQKVVPQTLQFVFTSRT